MNNLNHIYKSVLPALTTAQDSIEKRNQVFNNLDTIAQKKEIALDVLMLIKNESIVNSSGDYWGHQLHKIRVEDPKEFQAELLEIDENPTFRCTVCARGAAMLSIIRLGNEVSGNRFMKAEGTKEIVKGFDMTDMSNMEHVYEVSSSVNPYDSNTRNNLINIFLQVLMTGKFERYNPTDYLKELELKSYFKPVKSTANIFS